MRRAECFGESGMDVLYVTGVVVIIGLITTAAKQMLVENEFILAPNSLGLPLHPYHRRARVRTVLG